MKVSIRLKATCVAGVLMGACNTAHALFSEISIKQFCEEPNPHRQTIVYVSDAVPTEGETDWVVELDKKLRSGLTYRESVTVLEIKSRDGETEEIWRGCYPGYSSEEEAEIRDKTYIMSKDPLDQLERQRGLFSTKFREALTKIYHEEKGSRIPKKERDIFRSVASDRGRYSGGSRQTNIFLVTEGYDQWVADKGAEEQTTDLERANFYLINLDSSEEGNGLSDRKRAWHNTIKKNLGVFQGASTGIEIPVTRPAKAFNANFSVKLHGNTLSGNVSLFVDGDGDLISSYVALRNQITERLEGYVTSEKDRQFTVKASTGGDFITNYQEEQMRGKLDIEAGTFSGVLRVPNAYVAGDSSKKAEKEIGGKVTKYIEF